MSQLLAQPPRRERRWPWSRLSEASVTNIDVVMMIGAVVITLFVGVLVGAALIG